MIDAHTFTEEQKKFLSSLVSDFGGPTSTGSLLYIIENLLYTLAPDWELKSLPDDSNIKNDLEVCLAALQYLKVKDAIEP